MDFVPSASRPEGTEMDNLGYSLQHMKEARQDIQNEHTYTEATEGRLVSRSTLHTHVHKQYPDDSKPKRGPKYKLCMSDELHLVEYTNYCWERNVPRTQEMLKSDINHYMYSQGIVNTFKHGEPGRGWFSNLKKNHDDLRIASQSTANEYQNMPVSEKDWVIDRDHLIRTVMGEKVFPSKQNIFIIEMDTIRDTRHPHIKFEVLIPYNAKADILLPFVIHNDLLGGNVRHYFRECFAFTYTEEACVDHECLYQCVQYIERYMRDQELTFPGIVYLQPELSDYLSLVCWLWATHSGIIVCSLPRAVFSRLRPSDLGLFRSILTKMHPYLLKQIYPMTDDPPKEHLLNAFLQVLKNGKLLGHITKTFQKMKLLTVRREKRQKRDILHELLGRTNHFRKKPYNCTPITT